jgi:hypothetical protein
VIKTLCFRLFDADDKGTALQEAIAALPSDYPSTAWHPWRGGFLSHLAQGAGSGVVRTVSAVFYFSGSFYVLNRMKG